MHSQRITVFLFLIEIQSNQTKQSEASDIKSDYCSVATPSLHVDAELLGGCNSCLGEPIEMCPPLGLKLVNTKTRR